MTVVLAIPFFRNTLIIADSRVSYENRPDIRDDVLQKLYPFVSDQYGVRVIMGFSGPLSGAFRVMDAVRVNARAYSKPAVANSLLPDIERWIRHEYKQIRNPAEKRGLSFIVAAVEPTREERFKWQNSDGEEIPRPGWFPQLTERRFFSLRRSPVNSNELIKEFGFNCVIGIRNDQVRNKVADVFQEHYGAPFQANQPEIQAHIVLMDLMHFFGAAGYEEVGGLFQCAILGPQGVRWLSYDSSGSIRMDWDNGRYIQVDETTGRTIPLMSLWEWKRKQPIPGTFGVFEDPVYQR